MFLYENNKCPVCEKEFAEGDDVVVCPECGTPHHRECYKSIGKCANKNLHATDFIYKRDKYKAEEAEKINQVPIYNLADEIKTAVEASVNADASDGEKADSDIKQNESDEIKIDGVAVSDVKTVVGVNSEKFIKRFSKNRKIGWNWGAFFFGPYYFMFRKMYGESLVFLALPYAVNMIINYAFESAMLVYNNIYTEMLKIMMTYDYAKLSDFLKDSLAAPENKQAWTIFFVTMGISLLLRIIAAVIADFQYRKKVVKAIKTVDEKVDMGESFSLIGPMMGNENMSQSELRKMFLSKQGGVSLLFPILIVSVAVFSYMI